MLIKVEENKENEKYEYIKHVLSNEDFNSIKKDIEKEMQKCGKDSAISLVSIFGSDWTNTSMQAVYNALGDVKEAGKYAGIILKEIIYGNRDYYFEQKKLKNGMSCYYKR